MTMLGKKIFGSTNHTVSQTPSGWREVHLIFRNDADYFAFLDWWNIGKLSEELEGFMNG